MIPITRKEKYINEIVGGGDTAPETPQTREEFFFAEILGEVIAPSPITRAEKYLSAIAGQYSGDLPTPITRIEYFLARAAGMDVNAPTPVTREEMFWADYALIVEKELSGIPPLTFKGKGKDLKNYRIYGNTVNGENVGDLITEGEHAGEYSVPVTVSNGTDTLTTPIYLSEPIKMVGEEAEYIDYAEQKQHGVRKNLLKITIGNMTMGRDNDDPVTYPGVTITINADKSITFNGRVRSTLYIPIGSIDDLKKGSYYLSGCPINGADNSYKLYVQNQSITSFDIGSGVRFNYISSLSTLSTLIRLYGGYTCDNLTFYPMVRKASIEDDTYEPYIENTDLNVTLPALPVLPGTNTLTVGTEVQPSSVEIKGRIQEVTP